MHTELPHFRKEVLCETTTLRELCFENPVQNPFVRQRTTSPILLCETISTFTQQACLKKGRYS